MVTLMSLLVMDKASIGSLSSGVFIGLVVLGMVALLFTSYRFLIGYFMAGMGYWLWVEALHWVVARVLPNLETMDSYFFAFIVSLLPVVGLLVWQPKQRPSTPIAPTTTALLRAGQRPVVLEKDTDFYQHFVRHSSLTDK